MLNPTTSVALTIYNGAEIICPNHAMDGDLYREAEREGLRTLEYVCIREEGRFFRIVAGNVYCSLAWTKPVQCLYCALEPDVNGLYACEYPTYNSYRDVLLYFDFD